MSDFAVSAAELQALLVGSNLVTAEAFMDAEHLAGSDNKPLDEALVDIRSCVLTHPFDAKAARCEPLQDCLRRY